MAEDVTKDPFLVAQPAPFSTMGDLWPQTAELATLEDLIDKHHEELERNGGDLEAIEEIRAFLAFPEEQFLERLVTWALKVQVLEADAAVAKAERVRLQAKESTWEKAAKNLKGYILGQMKVRNVPKHKTPIVSVSVAKNSRASVRAKDAHTLEELYAIGSPFVKMKVEYVIDSDAVIEAAKNGTELPEGILVETGSHVRIR